MIGRVKEGLSLDIPTVSLYGSSVSFIGLRENLQGLKMRLHG
jgi:hypothetical protein